MSQENYIKKYHFNGCVLEVFLIEGTYHHRVNTKLKSGTFKKNLIELIDILSTHHLDDELLEKVRKEIV